MTDHKQLLLANKAWAEELTEQQPDFFSRQTAGQKPDFLWIGCSDSRVGPEQMTMSPPGSLFMHRNIANLVDERDLNLMSVLQYAVDVLGVKHIVVCGHYGCGGVAAALDGHTVGGVHHWLSPVRDLRVEHADELHDHDTHKGKVNHLVEINIRTQVAKLANTKTVQEAFLRDQELHLHGWVYDIGTGLIRTLLEIDRDSSASGSSSLSLVGSSTPAQDDAANRQPKLAAC